MAKWVAAGAFLVWNWLDMKTFTGPERLAAAETRIGAIAVMLVAAIVGWSRMSAGKDREA
jgi:hypothetical protein